MRAWQYVADGVPLTLTDVPEPGAGTDEVVLDVKAAGICHSDLGYLDGSLSHLIPRAPMTLGHEVAGVVRELGRGVTEYALGDRVAVLGYLDGPGTGRDGGFAPRVSVQTRLLVRVPDQVAWDQAAVSTDAGTTAYHAVQVRGGVRAGDRVGIIGHGGLGSLGTQVALDAGAQVWVAEIDEGLHDEIERAGVRGAMRGIEDFEVEFDVVVDFVGTGSTTAAALRAVRSRGRVVRVGLAQAEATIDTVDLTVRQLELLGSLGGSVADNAEVLQMMADGRLFSKTRAIDFDQVATALGRLAGGGVAARFVVLLP